jgi:hypothetical protein
LPGDQNARLEFTHRWEVKVPRIWNLAVSPDAQFVAFVLCQDGAHDETGVLYITRLECGQATYPERYAITVFLDLKEFSSLIMTAVYTQSSHRPPKEVRIPAPL